MCSKDVWKIVGPIILITVTGVTTAIIKLVGGNDAVRDIKILDKKNFDVKVGENVRVTIPADELNLHEKCFIYLNNGERYSLTEELSVIGIKIIENYNYACGVNIDIRSKTVTGDWTLVSWEIMLYYIPIERRLPFTINVQDNGGDNTESKQIMITEGSDLYLHLDSKTDLSETCKLVGPDENESVNFELDPKYLESCGFIIKNVKPSDSGTWEIRYGNGTILRAFTEVTVNVSEAMSARQYSEQSTLVVEGQVDNSRQLEYCRFVRIDGLGISSENLPDRYTSHDSLATGLCRIRIEDATILDHHSWTVVARILGQDVEISQSTMNTITMPPAADPGNLNNQLIFWIPMILLVIVLTALVVLLAPKSNRKRTLDRMNIIRDSIRSSFQKKPLQDPPSITGVTVA
ncbi:uncharacterized protein LOC131846573 [Achroia grisella]|uniref:uncharacterized protein LOC131846573 n=1 Tax=Achroia grisella TaxID=688607 RepID=UPI0027D3137A|nr:uncharacterized protein LOC131846573 [Achroia grisella]